MRFYTEVLGKMLVSCFVMMFVVCCRAKSCWSGLLSSWNIFPVVVTELLLDHKFSVAMFKWGCSTWVHDCSKCILKCFEKPSSLCSSKHSMFTCFKQQVYTSCLRQLNILHFELHTPSRYTMGLRYQSSFTKQFSKFLRALGVLAIYSEVPQFRHLPRSILVYSYSYNDC